MTQDLILLCIFALLCSSSFFGGPFWKVRNKFFWKRPFMCFSLTCRTVSCSRWQLPCAPGCRYRGGAGRWRVAEAAGGLVGSPSATGTEQMSEHIQTLPLCFPVPFVWSVQVHVGVRIFVSVWCCVWHESGVDRGPAGADRLPYGVSHHRRGLRNEGQSCYQPVRGEKVRKSAKRHFIKL